MLRSAARNAGPSEAEWNLSPALSKPDDSPTVWKHDRAAATDQVRTPPTRLHDQTIAWRVRNVLQGAGVDRGEPGPMAGRQELSERAIEIDHDDASVP
jgi:hypothetical protein